MSRPYPIKTSRCDHRRTAEPLTDIECPAALEFLGRRPRHTVIMSGWLRDFGAIHPQHRGTFYRTLDADGRISGVALIGKNTLFEVSSRDATLAIAERARVSTGIKLVIAETDKMPDFWETYSRGRLPRQERSALLISISERLAVATKDILQKATSAQFDRVLKAHAEMTFEETGIDPLSTDDAGFRRRCLERINKGLVWIAMQGDKLAFKIDIISRTPQAIYIEGLWVAPEFRGRGLARMGIMAFVRRFLNGSNTICGFVCPNNLAARAVYRSTGFSFGESYLRYYL